MPLSDLAVVLKQAAQVFSAAGIPFVAFPMHEVAAHPEAARVMALFQEAVESQTEALFEPLSTTGVPFATRPDWQELFETCHSLGTTVVFLAVHGAGDVHDQAVHRAGAYQETLLAARRARSVGLGVGCNVFLTKANVGQFDTMVGDLQRCGVTQFSFEPPTYYPTGRGWRSEALRPELNDLLPLAEQVRQLSPFNNDLWENLDVSTEAAHVRRAATGDWTSEPRHTGEIHDLVCRANFDVFSGVAGRYRKRHGNLRDDGVEVVLHTALEYGARPYDSLWFSLDPVPDVQELAARYGDAHGQRVHFSAESLRYRWLDLAQQAARRLSRESE